MPLPGDVGTAEKPPALACYISDAGAVWLVVAGASAPAGDPSCALAWTGDQWTAVLIDAPAGWLAGFVVVY